MKLLSKEDLQKIARNTANFSTVLEGGDSTEISAGTIISGQEVYPYTVVYFPIRHLQKKDKFYYVGIYCVKTTQGYRFSVVCGDDVTSGTLSSDIIEARAGQLNRKGTSLASLSDFVKNHNCTLPVACGGNKSFENYPARGGCLHMRHFYASVGELELIFKALEEKHFQWFANCPVIDLGAVQVSASPEKASGDFEIFNKYVGKDESNKVPLLIIGEQGSSKTYQAREFGMSQGFEKYIEVGCHASMESYDFIGGQVPTKDGLAWMDGPIAQAFRLASKGKKVCLLVDEIYRTSRRERSVFLTVLSPHRGVYRLTTGRPLLTEDGVYEMEVLEAPVKNLSIIATTNVGAGFEIEDDDPAQKERWMVVYKSTTEQQLREVLTPCLTSKGFNVKDTMKKLISFFSSMKKLKNDLMILFNPTVRTLTRAVAIAKTEEEIPAILKDMSLTWVGLDLNGVPIKEQVDAVNYAIESSFKEYVSVK